ncbi:MAG: hypothetical protein IPK82_17975 [Polyangiaceae bacterium]|nr:hypothetical protein [Polyangiaceae bacterium]
MAEAVFGTSQPTPRLPSRPRWNPVVEAWLAQSARLETNRRNGWLMERAAGRDVEAKHPDAQHFEQLRVRDDDGQLHIIDRVAVDRSGVANTYEVKNVRYLSEGHVRQAERQHAALKANGVAVSDKPTVVVRQHTVVAPKHEERVNVLRTKMRKRTT